MRKAFLCVFVVLAAMSIHAGIVEESGVTGGIVVKIGCQSGEALARLLVSGKYLVHGLDSDEKVIAESRDFLQKKGLYGRISVARFDGKQLPYAENCVNLLVMEDAGFKVSRKEIMRVLVPRGVAMVGGKKIVKPVPDTIDDWTHFLHGPDNNAVAQDTEVAAPKTIKWVAEPKWARSHEEAASVSAMVSEGGRIFYILDEAPRISIRFMPKWKLVARDAFNGSLLWKRDITGWSDHLRHFRAGPTHLPCRLVAVDGKVYVTLGLSAPVSILDALTGKTLKVLQGSEHTEEIIVDKGAVYLAVGTSEVHRRGGGLHTRGEPEATDFRYIAAYSEASGKQLWRKDFTGKNFLLPTTMTVRRGSVFYQDINGVGRLDAGTGDAIWRKERPTVARRMSFISPTVVATDDILLVADRTPQPGSDKPDKMAAVDKVEWGVHGWNEKGFPRRCPNLLVAYSVKDGAILWSQPCTESYNSAVDVFVVGDKVHIGMSWARFDLKTGKKEEGANPPMKGGKVGMAHHRCYRNKASVNYVFTGRSGIEVADLEKGWLGNNSWIRGACQYGIMPANGMLYAPPDACGCFNKVKVQGFFATGPARDDQSGKMDDAARLYKGPAYGRIGDAPRMTVEDWPMHRRDREKSGGVKTRLARALKKSWSVKLGGRLSQAVMVGDTVYVAQTDAHTVHALNAADGGRKWCFTADGRIDSPPSVFKGMVLFGSADGCVYCLRAADGALAWRFQAAPEARLLASYGQLESAWPVHGSVLIQNGALYTSAGRNTYLDGGITFYKMDPATGKVLKQNTLYNFDRETGAQLGPEGRFDMDGVNTAILSGDGENIFMKQERLSDALERLPNNVPHLFGVHGFLGEEWFVRSYWLLGTNVRAGWGGWASGNETTFGRILSFDDANTFGYGRKVIQAGATGHKADAYHLFGVKKVMQTTAGSFSPRVKRQKGSKAPAKKSRKPVPFWADEQSLIVRAMVLAGDKVVVAGPPDLRKKDAGVLAYMNEDEALASFMGRKGVFLRAMNAADGEMLFEGALDAMPVFDGMSAARGKLFISLKNGEIQCWQ